MTGKGGNGCSGALVGSKTAIESSEPIAGLIPLLGEGNKALLRGVGRASDGQELGIILPQKRSSLLGYEVLICMVMRYQLVSIGSRHPRYLDHCKKTNPQHLFNGFHFPGMQTHNLSS